MHNGKRLTSNSASVDFRVLLSRFSNSFCWGCIKLCILPLQKKWKSGQNNPKKRRSLGLWSVSRQIGFFLWILFFWTSLAAETDSLREIPELGSIPVYYEGRIRPLESCASSWMHSVYNRNHLLPEHRQFFLSPISNPLEFLWSLHSPNAEKFPLFWIGEKELKETLQLTAAADRFCYEELRHVFENVLEFNLKVIEQMILASFFKVSQGVSFYPGQKLHLRVNNAEIECLFFENEIVVTSAPAAIPWNFLCSLCRSCPYAIELKDPLAFTWLCFISVISNGRIPLSSHWEPLLEWFC